MRRDEETISNISIVHAEKLSEINYMREKPPAPEFNIDDKYFDVVGQICSYEDKIPADVAVRN